MNKGENTAVAAHELDLWEYREGDVEEVPNFLRDLPSKYGITSGDMKLPYLPSALKERMDSDNPEERAEAESIGQRCYFLVINLMRAESGLDFTAQNIGDWRFEDLFGKRRKGHVNLGNERQRSMQVPQIGTMNQEYAQDAEPGQMFRQVSYKDNFFVVLASLRYFDGGKLTPDKLARIKQSKNHLKGRAILTFVDNPQPAAK